MPTYRGGLQAQGFATLQSQVVRPCERAAVENASAYANGPSNLTHWFGLLTLLSSY